MSDKPGPGPLQGTQSAGKGNQARAGLETRLQHGCKVQPGDEAKDRA